jgi:hypothetical protein
MWRREPILIGLAGADAAVLAVLVALNALSVTSLSGSQLAAISAAVVAVTSLLGAILRAAVVSPATHDVEVDRALHAPAPISWGGDV